MTLLTLDRVSLVAPDGRPLFSDLSLSLGTERVGLVGRNGSGKSSLLNLIADGGVPSEGTIQRGGKMALLSQLPPDDATPVPVVLGIGEAWARLDRIGRGVGSETDFDEADWSLAARVDALLTELGLPAAIMERRIGTLSGGERTRVMLAKLLIGAPDMILLDEPTNNLDADGRAAIAALLERWKGGALVASHDRELLNRMDRIVELTPIGCRIFGGGWNAFVAAREASRDRAAAELERTSRAVKQAERAKQTASEKQARRDRVGKAFAASGSAPKILLGAQKRRAEATAGRASKLGDALVDEALEARAEAARAMEIVTPIRFAVPPSGLSSNHILVEAHDLVYAVEGRTLFGPISFTIKGPERIALTGRNGSGKTSLTRLILGQAQPQAGSINADQPRIALLDQHMSLLDAGPSADASLIATMQRLNPALSAHDARAALASAGFRGSWGEREVHSLSGGERVRFALACLFARPAPPQLLILDEPTNHLDIEATELLEAALTAYDGAILCVSHDTAFREAIGLRREIGL